MTLPKTWDTNSGKVFIDPASVTAVAMNTETKADICTVYTISGTFSIKAKFNEFLQWYIGMAGV